MTNTHQAVDGRLRRETVGLGFLFASVYFVQAIADPSDGLITQPLTKLLKDWQWEERGVTRFMAILSIPWALKPLYGLLTDFLPMAGYRRKSYLLLAGSTSTLCLFILGSTPLVSEAYRGLFLLLFLPVVSVSVADVVVDALMVEKGQARGITGLLQSIQWAAMNTGTLFIGVAGGWISEKATVGLACQITACFCLASVLLTIFGVRERRHERPTASLATDLRVLWKDCTSPMVLCVCLFLFLWNFNPFSTTVLNLYMTKGLGFGEQFYGLTSSIIAGASIAACLGYGWISRRVPMRFLVHASIVLSLVSSLAYWGLYSETSAIVISIVYGLTYMVGNLISLDLAARTCPPEVAGTLFAVIMAISNLGTTLAIWAGGEWYQDWREMWGAQTAFNLLVGVGAGCTAACWLLWPVLRRQAVVTAPAPVAA
jgi:predicted MFS family arabinose efflux permease